MFIAMSNDDPVGPGTPCSFTWPSSTPGVPAELHIFATGGHGYGMRKSDNPASTWPQRCEEWLRNEKLLGPTASRAQGRISCLPMTNVIRMLSHRQKRGETRRRAGTALCCLPSIITD